MRAILPLVFLAAACVAPERTEDPAGLDHTRIEIAGETATANERTRCEAVGGEIRRDGLLGRELCIQTFADAGQACHDSADCLGDCRLEGEFIKSGTPTDAGTCQVRDTPFGCFQTVEAGQARPAICVD